MKKENVDIYTASLLIVIGIVLMVLPLFNIHNLKLTLIIVMSLYTIFNAIQFILTRKSKDYEGLFTSIASIISIILLFTLDINNSKYLALIILIWVSLMAVIKLKKADYYHDRLDNLWILKILNISFFIVLGILTSLNLFYHEVQILILGYFFLIHGFLELIEPVTIKLLKAVQK